MNMLPSPPAESDYRARPKRKLGDVETEETRDCSFQLENLGDDSLFTFEPVCKLLRAHLPLSWLAAAHTTDVVPSGSLLRGTISRVTAWEYSILVARLLPNGGFYALEKVDQDCYVLHTLQPFVSTKWVMDASIGASPAVNTQMMLHYLPIVNASESNQPTSRRTLSISSESELKVAKNRRGAAARLSILGQATKQESLPASPTLPDLPPVLSIPEEELVKMDLIKPGTYDAAPANVDEKSVESQEIPQDVTPQSLDMLSPEYLRQRYLENLYTTRSPLAYYSKGPLSRARARARAPDASVNLGDLAAFYRDSLLPAKKLDLKYKQSVRESITQIMQNSPLDREGSKKSKKRTRLGKDGLWPMELKYIAKWWRDSQNSSMGSTMLESHVQQAICSLRMREAQMQILLILEILAIEAKQIASPSVTLENTGPKIESIEGGGSPTGRPQKAAKTRSLDTELELLADKLCIWHSIGLEDTVLSAPTTSRELDDTRSHSKDSLRNFCAEVLIPFYSSKLPLICKALCKTLAGSELYDRATKTTRLNDDQSKAFTPGVALQRRPPSRSSTMDRVVSDDNFRHPSPPVLLRSATLPPIPQVKRETSETPRRHMSRQASMSFTNREVDLVADANVAATKKRKLDLVAMQKQELASAIQALKKPNRQTTAKHYMDDMEARKTKIKKPILITATPRTNRKRMVADGEATLIPEQFMVPSSGIKQRNNHSLPIGTPYSSNKKAVLAALQGTPSRISKITHSQALPEGEDSFVFTTPVKRAPVALSTPTKRAGPEEVEKETDFPLSEVAFKVMDRAMQKPVSYSKDSIYAQLGWEDDHFIDT